MGERLLRRSWHRSSSPQLERLLAPSEYRNLVEISASVLSFLIISSLHYFCQLVLLFESSPLPEGCLCSRGRRQRLLCVARFRDREIYGQESDSLDELCVLSDLSVIDTPIFFTFLFCNDICGMAHYILILLNRNFLSPVDSVLMFHENTGY